MNWNGKKLLEGFLPQVIANTPDADVIVADNASTDGSAEWLTRNYPGMTLLRFEENLGYAGGYNAAIKRLPEYENIILLNSDAWPAQGWIKPIETMLETPGIVAVQPKILAENDHTFFEYAGAAGGMLDRNGYPYCRGRIFDRIEEDKGQYNEAAEIFWASGAALAVKREAYMDVGGLDTLFFAHMEEIDLCWRLKLNGGKIFYQPLSVVYHLGGGSLDASSPRKTFLNFRNNLLMLHKNLPPGKRKRALLFRRRLLDTLAIAKFAVTGKFPHAREIVHAHNEFRKLRNNYNDFPNRDLLEEECKRNILLERYL